MKKYESSGLSGIEREWFIQRMNLARRQAVAQYEHRANLNHHNRLVLRQAQHDSLFDCSPKGLCCEPNRALASKCITGKILTPENSIFEHKLIIGAKYFIIAHQLLPEILLLRAGQWALAHKRVGKTINSRLVRERPSDGMCAGRAAI